MARKDDFKSQLMEEVQRNIKQAILSNLTSEQLSMYYNKWAITYEKDSSLVDYQCPKQLANYIEKLVGEKTSKILDIGAGTGLLGLELKNIGYTDIDAVEPSEVMAEIATERGVYCRIIMDYVDKHRLDIQDATYELIVGAGVFVPGHVKEDCFEELIRITKPGGLIAVTCSEQYYGDQFQGYAQNLDRSIMTLEKRGVWARYCPDGVIKYREHYKAYVKVLRKL